MSRDVCRTCGVCMRDYDSFEEMEPGPDGRVISAMKPHGCANPVGSMPWNDGQHYWCEKLDARGYVADWWEPLNSTPSAPSSPPHPLRHPPHLLRMHQEATQPDDEQQPADVHGERIGQGLAWLRDRSEGTGKLLSMVTRLPVDPDAEIVLTKDVEYDRADYERFTARGGVINTRGFRMTLVGAAPMRPRRYVRGGITKAIARRRRG